MGNHCQQPREVGFGASRADVLLRYPTVTWEGWGTSLAWWGKVVGASPDVDAWVDLFFGKNEIPMNRIWPDQDPQEKIPCLGLNILRYNIGGVGRVEVEKSSHRSRGWHAEIEGFQPEEGSDFDWSRDAEQRKCLQLAVDRGVDYVEVFSNAPMWWMTDSSSSFGGNLVKEDEYVSYLAEVAAHLRSEGNYPLRSLSPFNEPCAGWWKFPHDQEGCNIPIEQQERILLKLRGALDLQGLQDVIIAASDENTPQAALNCWDSLHKSSARGCVSRLNVHGYDGLKPWAESSHPGVRWKLRDMARGDGLSVWISEYGGGDESGLALAQSILEDLHFLRPTAWIYWQILEHQCSWGLIQCDFSHEGAQHPQLPHPKYYVFAHFTRYILPGVDVLHCTEPLAIAAYSAASETLTCVLMNVGSDCRTLDLQISEFSTLELSGEAVISIPGACRYFEPTTAEVRQSLGSIGFEISIQLPAASVCSLTVHSVTRGSKTRNATSFTRDQGVTAEQVAELARCTAVETVTERRNGEWDTATQLAKSRVEHWCAVASASLQSEDSAKTAANERQLGELIGLVRACAWGVANERAYGQSNPDAQRDFEDFKTNRQLYRFGDDVDWAIFNTCWAVGNGIYHGAESSTCKDCSARVEDHLRNVGRSTLVLPRKTFNSASEVSSAPRWLAFIRHAEAGHNVNPELNSCADNPLTSNGAEQALAAGSAAAGEALRAADLVVTTPLLRALQTTSLMLAGADCSSKRIRVNPLASELRRHACDDGTMKQELMRKLPDGAESWEGWDTLAEQWWPGPEHDEDMDQRVETFRQVLNGLTEDRIVFVGHGAFWQKLLGCYLGNCHVVYSERHL